MVLCNRPTLSIGTERLACLNSPSACSWGPSPSTRQVPGSSPGSGGRAARSFFLHPPFLPPSGDSFFVPYPHQPRKSVRVNLKQMTYIVQQILHGLVTVPIRALARSLKLPIQNGSKWGKLNKWSKIVIFCLSEMEITHQNDGHEGS